MSSRMAKVSHQYRQFCASITACPSWSRNLLVVRITEFVGFVHLPEMQITGKRNASETGSVSVFKSGKGAPTVLGPLERAHHIH
jgi:hypothetical protein